MPDLSLVHIDRIAKDIRREEITFSHLLNELIDHVCCDVEYEMKNGSEFSEAYKNVKHRMGPRRLKEIQEETLYAVDTKYRKMKKTMKVSGIVGTIMIGFSAIFKIQHWPLAGILLTLGALDLAFIFMPSALSVLWKETHNRKRLFLFISGFFAGMFFILGTLFKVQHWPGAGIVISLAALSGIFLLIPALLADRLADSEKKSKRPVYILGAVSIACYSAGLLFRIMHWPLAGELVLSGLVIFCLVVFPWYTWLTWREENSIKASFIFIIIGSLLIIVPGALINLNLQHTYESGFYFNMGQQDALYKSMSESTNSKLNLYRDSTGYKDMEELHSKTEVLLDLIFNIEEEMILQAEGQPGEPAVNTGQMKNSDAGAEIQYLQLSRPFHDSPARDHLSDGANSRMKLDNAIKEYTDYISTLSSESENVGILSLLKPHIYFPAEMGKNGNVSLIVALHSIALLKNSILLFEAEAMKTLGRQ
jgi:gliding motility-associated GldL-like protein